MDDSESLQIDRRIPEAELNRRLAETNNVEELRRLGFIKNLYQGDSIVDAIDREGKSTSTGSRWKKRWENGGIESLMPETSSGRSPKLSEQQATAFRERVRKIPSWSFEQLENLLRKEFDVEYTQQYLQQKLPAFGVTYTKPALQTAIDEGTLKDIEWENNGDTETTKRNPYNEQKNRLIARWSVSEDV